ncbi:phosphotransferase system IIA component [Microbacterium dextranolyticum]|uniref:PTS EIIA type-1 domain-containing protein n=1 Tax=Microbacterium dextranolyticum TaxID=36806 RepID=A0A9W6HL06_9MICO|nr:phosphotransferase system IIA component [Microbacterium dextranolyticum]GLJ95106.1 hypothetical protein GCM10017591_11680 [Microbacterium dextranolyticum]
MVGAGGVKVFSTGAPGLLTLPIAIGAYFFGITSAQGAEVLVHIGIDTVALGGAPFTPHVVVGDRVEAGAPLVSVNLAAIRAAGLDPITPVVLVNSAGAQAG